ncbi:MAG: hypothetical protein FWD73_13605 [Polyangiaceae bacterium]|nr:hypothetical protein [Polyangiaceae bacterium]
MGIPIDFTSYKKPINLDSFNDPKEPEPPKKAQSSPSGISEETYKSLPDAPIDWSHVQTENQPGPAALAQGKADKAQQKDPAQASSAKTKRTADDVKDLRPSDGFLLGPPAKNSGARDGSAFTVMQASPLDRAAVPSLGTERTPNPALQKFSKGNGPFYQVNVSYLTFNRDTQTPSPHPDVWFYDAGAKLWGFYNKDGQFDTSNVGPQGRVIKDFVPFDEESRRALAK